MMPASCGRRSSPAAPRCAGWTTPGGDHRLLRGHGAEPGQAGAARAAAETPDELLARAVSAGLVRRGAAARLTALFYEARFSSHPLRDGQREAASGALAEIAAGLRPAPGRPGGETA